MRIATHSGSFHADEVLAVAALRLKYGPEGVEVVRTRDPEVIASADIVVDVGASYDGERRFDHHQGGVAPRANGVPYASFGLVWKRFGAEVSGSPEAASIVESRLVLPIDAEDNSVSTYEPTMKGVYPYTLHDIMHSLYPKWDDSAADFDKGFQAALELASGVLVREIGSANALLRSKAMFDSAYTAASDKRIVVLDGKYPFEEFMHQYPEVLFVVFPSATPGQWHTKAARDDFHFYDNRADLPESWAGKRDEELVRVTGVPDALFCHIGRFLAVARSREGAIRLAELAVGA